MSDNIYQKIWQADQQHAGLRAISKQKVTPQLLDQHRDSGYVIVNEDYREGRNLRLIEQVVIPAHKQKSYDKVRKLFDNYILYESFDEVNSFDEWEEIHSYLHHIYLSPPMQIAREFLNEKLSKHYDDDQWWELIRQTWFCQFTEGESKRDLSGFEHVMVGEHKARNRQISGYHFWYKYYCDENFEIDGEIKDLIEVLADHTMAGDDTPDVVSMKYRWQAYCHQTDTYTTLTKNQGGFWVGPSAEAILAMGLVRFHDQTEEPEIAIINGYQYLLCLHPSSDGKHIRTFYPVMRNPAHYDKPVAEF